MLTRQVAIDSNNISQRTILSINRMETLFDSVKHITDLLWVKLTPFDKYKDYINCINKFINFDNVEVIIDFFNTIKFTDLAQTISVEGDISIGKTTILTHLKKTYNIIIEPVEVWCSMGIQTHFFDKNYTILETIYKCGLNLKKINKFEILCSEFLET